MMIRIFIFAILVINSLLSCFPKSTDDECPPNCPEDTVKYPLDILWETYYYNDTSRLTNRGSISYKDNIIALGDTDYSEFKTFMFNKTTGKIEARFDYGLNPPTTMVVMNDWLIVSSLDGIYIDDLNTFERIIHIDKTFDSHFDTIGNYVYFSQLYGVVPFQDSSSVIRLSIPSLKIKKILTITKEEYGSFCSLNGVSLEAMGGDTIIYGFADVKDDFLFAFSTQKKEYIWKTGVDGYNDVWFFAPLYDDNRVYIIQNHKVRAYDKFTGQSLWERDIEGWAASVQPLLLDNRLYVRSTNKHLYCLDPNSGHSYWYNGDIFYGGRFGYDINNLYFADLDNFQVVNRSTGKIIFKAAAPYAHIPLEYNHDNREQRLKEWKRLYSRWAIDPIPVIDRENGVFYLPDNKRMFCFKLPKDW